MKLRLVPRQSDAELLQRAHTSLSEQRATVAFLTERVQTLLRSLDQMQAVLEEQARELDQLRQSRLS